MLFLEAENPERDISLYINSPGGSITAGLAIYDTMQYIKPDIATICIGQAASMAAVLLAGGAKRQALGAAQQPGAHPPAAALRPAGQATEIEIHAREILRMRERLDEILAYHTGSRSSRSTATPTATRSSAPRRRWTTASSTR